MVDAVSLKFKYQKLLEGSSNFFRVPRDQLLTGARESDELSLAFDFLIENGMRISVRKLTEKSEDQKGTVLAKESNEIDAEIDRLGIAFMKQEIDNPKPVSGVKAPFLTTDYQEKPAEGEAPANIPQLQIWKSIRHDMLRILNGYISNVSFGEDHILFGIKVDDRDKPLEIKYKEHHKDKDGKNTFQERSLFSLKPGEKYNKGDGLEKNQFEVVLK